MVKMFSSSLANYIPTEITKIKNKRSIEEQQWTKKELGLENPWTDPTISLQRYIEVLISIARKDGYVDIVTITYFPGTKSAGKKLRFLLLLALSLLSVAPLGGSFLSVSLLGRFIIPFVSSPLSFYFLSRCFAGVVFVCAVCLVRRFYDTFPRLGKAHWRHKTKSIGKEVNNCEHY